MPPDMQNPGEQAGASRNQLSGWLYSPNNASDWRAQMLASRFCLSPWMERDIVRHCFGEDCND